MSAFLEAGEPARAAAEASASHAAARIPLDDVRLEAPVLRPGKILAIGLNYADHVEESGLEAPKWPVIFNKQTTVVIGRRCRHVPRERAADVIAGYLVLDDVSVRDWQLRVPTMTIGKSFDTHCPMGPWIVTGDEIGDPHGLGIRTWVDGELRQDSNTKELITDCYDLVEHVSTAFTLEPGDVLSTGTPAGVGMAMKPPRPLVTGDVVRIEIERIGQIENPVIDEPEDTVRFPPTKETR
jgi:2-keto-4-pentenoate hydratase/2-oxohepta-3-ene-1,7-dioic acid hydratase in catechol pathway